MSTLPVKREPQNVVPMTPPDELTILQLAVERGAPIETIERLVALKEHMQDRKAESAFNEAMNRAQAEMRPVATDLDNPQTRSRYASYAALDKKLRPIYSKEGFALSFDTGDSPSPDIVRVLCHVSHSSGHTRTYKADMPADGKGAKGGDVMTKTHATGAAMSYGMRYLLKMIFNVAVGEDDNDGNGTIESWVEEYIDAIRGASDIDELRRLFGEAYTKASNARNKRAQDAFIQAKDERRKVLGK